MTISLTPVLNKQNFNALKTLADVCEQSDHITPRIYWDLTTVPRITPCHYLYTLNDHLVGYLGYYLFMTEEAELTALVHPDYRQQGIFTRLLNKAQDDLKQLGIKAIQFSFPEGQELAINYLTHRGAKPIYTEIQMHHTLQNGKPLDDAMPLHFQQAAQHDAALLAKIDHQCFGSDIKLMEERFRQILPESHRYAWIAYLNRQPIGKIHVRLEPEQAYVHDVGVLPDYQGQSYGKLIMRYLFNWLSRFGYQKICLEVMSTNQRALNLYKGLGFIVTRTDEYWRLELK